MKDYTRSYQVILPSAKRLVTCGNEVVALPDIIGENVWRLKNSWGRIVRQQYDLELSKGQRIMPHAQEKTLLL